VNFVVLNLLGSITRNFVENRGKTVCQKDGLNCVLNVHVLFLSLVECFISLF
jgi:hypothetical protein